MSEIRTFSFDRCGAEEIRNYKYGKNWPVVYIIENRKELYVGETINAYGRTRQHLDNSIRTKLKNIHVIADDESNKSATLDIESSLIEYLVGDGQFSLQNSSKGLQNHNYFDREKYQAKFEVLWEELRKKELVKKDLLQIRNSDLFKYSPYKTLTDDQYLVAEEILKSIQTQEVSTYLVNGGPGTGKTILATYLVKQFVEEGKNNVGLVISMIPLRNTLKKVFRSVPGLKSSMVIGPNDVTKQNYDVLVVDEAHRLRQRVNIANYKSFDDTNRTLGLNRDATELDWIISSAKHAILFFDERQTVRPSDISISHIKSVNPKEFVLKTQLRVKGGENYIHFIDSLLEGEEVTVEDFDEYDFKIYDEIGDMVNDIKKQEKKHRLSRLVAGYAWKWTRDKEKIPDIVINGLELYWNSQTKDWVNSPNAINEVGCIHTIQGYDLNYAGVILGPEISYDFVKEEIIVKKGNYLDINGHRGVTDEAELKRYIINIYKTLLTRGIMGTYVYICDENLRRYMLQMTNHNLTMDKAYKETKSVLSPITVDMLMIPLVGSAPCGNPLFGEENIEKYVQVDKSKIKPGFNYFILRAYGDSMDLAGIHHGDLVLCRQQLKADTGDLVVALLDDNVTIKAYGKNDGRRVLLPKSTNKSHGLIVPEEGDSVQGIVQEIIQE
jgi:uncharacterized protein